MLAIFGYDERFLVPKLVARIDYAAAGLSGNVGDEVLLVGMKTSDGTMTADVDIVLANTEDDAARYAGQRSQLRQMYRMARKAAPTARIKMIAVAEPTGTAATVTIVLSGTWSTGGTWIQRLAGRTITADILPTDTLSTIGPVIVAAINGKPDLPFTASWNGGTSTITITCANLGLQGKRWQAFVDNTFLPTGMSFVLTGSAANGTNRVFFGASASGTGSEDVTNVVGKITDRRYAKIAVGQIDSTNAGRWLTANAAKWLPTSFKLDQLIFGSNDTETNAATISQTTLNLPQAQVMWGRYLENHPCEMAAWEAAYRSVDEITNPVPDQRNLEMTDLTGVQAGFESDIPTETEQNTALNAGLTPIKSFNGRASVVRAVTSYSLVPGTSNQDLRCLDIGDANFPIYAVYDVLAWYESEWRPNNKFSGPSLPQNDRGKEPTNVGTPDRFAQALLGRMNGWFKNGWIQDPTLNPPIAEWNSQMRRMMSAMPMLVNRPDSGIGVIAKQI